jgi:phosphate starvation-inducible PhoH-like protein
MMVKDLVEFKYEFPDSVNIQHIYGSQDAFLLLIEQQLQVRLIARGHQVRIIGSPEEVKVAEHVLNDLVRSLEMKKTISAGDVNTAIQIARLGMPAEPEAQDARNNGELVLATVKGVVQPKSEGQRELVNALKKNDIIFAVGPAGTGKTYLAVAMAAAYLRSNRVKKIILARPAVEAGESLGFLPGDIKEKIDPYLKPLYDALEDMLPRDLLKKYLDQDIIEILPLAYMRGRTLNNAFVILDEAQNSTFTQMKMFLTRLGFNAKAIITGDITQIDLPSKRDSGLISSIRILSDITGIAFVYLSKNDVVRHYLVKEIIDAYDRFDESAAKPPSSPMNREPDGA